MRHMMAGVPVSPRRVFGVDFSAASDAGRHIWICRAHPGSAGIRVESVDPLVKLPGGARDRESSLASLVQKVLEAPRSAWGFDFSFGLPVELLASDETAAASGWERQLAALTAWADADEMRRWCRKRAGGRELRRQTDEEASTPFSPYNLRIYRQTYHGIRDVLRPLWGRPDVAILPMDALPAGGPAEAEGRLPFNVGRPGSRVPHIYLMETCPASLLRQLGYLPELSRYKGEAGWRAERRAAILGRLIEAGLVRPVGHGLRSRIVDDVHGDALDAVLAAVASWRGYRDYDHGEIRENQRYAVEGHVYL
jgi:hypothetical protein